MNRLILIVAMTSIVATSACTPARLVGKAAVTTGKVVVGAADVVL